MNLFSIYHKKNIFFCENLKTAENKQHILIEERSVKENASWAQARKPGYNSDGRCLGVGDVSKGQEEEDVCRLGLLECIWDCLNLRMHQFF